MKSLKLFLALAAVPAAHLIQPAMAQTPARPTLKLGAALTMSGVTTGAVYAIQCTTNLAQSNGWRCAKIVKPPTNSYAVPGISPAAADSCFYRAAANLVWIPPGTYTMGSPTNEFERYSDEGPQTVVTISKGFYLAMHPVTQMEYASVMTNNPSAAYADPQWPVDSVTWTNARDYCTILTSRELAAGRIPAGWKYRLPTEAEHEYAARAGTTNRFFFGADTNYAILNDYAWHTYNSVATAQVGQKAPSPWGLYDVYGNIWEWCQDWYAGSYPGGHLTDPTGPATGTQKVLRGGSWNDDPSFCRSACRLSDTPGGPPFSNTYGFRVVLSN